LSPGQKDALAFLVLKFGPMLVGNSKMIKELNEGNYEAVPEDMKALLTPFGDTVQLMFRHDIEVATALWQRTDGAPQQSPAPSGS
jgi:GH24 family phage-related lysozyme (muramidase)